MEQEREFIKLSKMLLEQGITYTIQDCSLHYKEKSSIMFSGCNSIDYDSSLFYEIREENKNELHLSVFNNGRIVLQFEKLLAKDIHGLIGGKQDSNYNQVLQLSSKLKCNNIPCKCYESYIHSVVTLYYPSERDPVYMVTTKRGQTVIKFFDFLLGISGTLNLSVAENFLYEKIEKHYNENLKDFYLMLEEERNRIIKKQCKTDFIQ